MRLALHILWFAVSMVGIIFNSALIEAIHSSDHTSQDFIMPVIIILVSIASAVASIYLYVR